MPVQLTRDDRTACDRDDDHEQRREGRYANSAIALTSAQRLDAEPDEDESGGQPNQ